MGYALFDIVVLRNRVCFTCACAYRDIAAPSSAVCFTPDAQSYQVLGTCNRLPRWQSIYIITTNVMNSLEYGVNLSRRACRIGQYGIMFLLTAGLCSGVPIPPNHAADIGVSVERRQTPVNLDYNVYDLSNLYKNIPTQARPYDDTPTTTKNILDEMSSVVESTVESKTDKRYPVISVSFQRVETPFIIGLWIFCASLAKIGK